MTSHSDDERTLTAATFLRAQIDSLALRHSDPDAFDGALAAALLDGDDRAARAQRVRDVLSAEPGAAARLATWERTISDPDQRERAWRGLDGPAGDPGTVPSTIWTCPVARDIRRLQVRPAQDMGVCPSHGVALVVEVA
jgi:hypothetical protein